jgi:hypothetical protein
MTCRKSFLSASAVLLTAGTFAIAGSALAGSPALPVAPAAGVSVGNVSAGNLEPAGSAMRVQAMIDAEGGAANHNASVPAQAAFGSSAPAAPAAPSSGGAPAAPVNTTSLLVTAVSAMPSAPSLPSSSSSSAPSAPPQVTDAANGAKAKATAQEGPITAKADPVVAEAAAHLAQMNPSSKAVLPALPSGPSGGAPHASITANATASANGTTQSANQSIMLPPSSPQ